MGYKLLGFVVWQVAKLYLRKRYPNGQRNLAIAGLGAVLLGGAVAAGAARQRSSD
jgi:hypothetical protein